jgi:hypothetical protein
MKLNLDALDQPTRAFELANKAMAESARAAVENFSAEMGALFQDFQERLGRSMQESLSGMLAEMRRSTTALEPDALRMGELGWTVPTWEALHLVSAIVRNVPVGELDNYFASLYAKRFRERERELLRELPTYPLLEKWSPLLREVVHCYRRKTRSWRRCARSIACAN